MVSNIDIMKAYVQYMDPEHQYEVVEMTEYQKKNSPACFLNTEKVSSL
ncbi:MAG: hypothetical protein U9Q15_05305 [Patescibacteria group bacterium]|nr:hypothetical protein [Patescibacteria group bacterium]